jgi:cell wall-associated NlpC family hydrolase
LLHRILLTGTLAFSLSAALCGAASATQTVAVTSVPSVTSIVPQTAPEGGYVSPAAIAAAKRRLAALEAKAPTAGADLAMWGASRASDEVAASPADVPSAVHRFASGIINRSATLVMALTRNAMRFLGVPYVFGGTSVVGFDCSGYVQHVFAMLGLHLPRTADAQYAAAHRILGAMRPGDLVFFQTYERGASHVGIYLGHDRFIHSSSSHGVVVSSLQDHYWSERYLGAKRVVN